MSWTIRVPMQKDESISSWLVRTALEQGCDPMVLTGNVWPEWRAWTLDLDRGIDSEHRRVLSIRSGIAVDRLEAASLRLALEKAIDRELPERGTWPWITTLGKRNRRQLGGLSFCPECVAGDSKPYFRRRWRFSWQTTCKQHRIRLLSHCHACAESVQPHRLLAENRDLAVCSACGADLGEAPHEAANVHALGFASRANRVLSQGRGKFWDGVVPASDWFKSVRHLITWTRVTESRKTCALAKAFKVLDVHETKEGISPSGLPFELLDLADRDLILASVGKLMASKKEHIQDALLQSAVSVNALADKRAQTPKPIQELCFGMPSVSRIRKSPAARNSGKPRSKRAVMAAWARLQRKYSAGLKL